LRFALKFNKIKPAKYNKNDIQKMKGNIKSFMKKMKKKLATKTQRHKEYLVSWCLGGNNQ
jgi:hypothetical protein